MISNLEFDELVSSWLDGRITESESEQLQQHLRESAEARARFQRFASLDSALRGMAGGDFAPDDFLNSDPFANQAKRGERGRATSPHWGLASPAWKRMAVVAATLLVVGTLAYQLGKLDTLKAPPVSVSGTGPKLLSTGPAKERILSGNATLRRGDGIKWSNNLVDYRDGDVLPSGVLEFDEGVAEIDFFSGAKLIVEGPAKLDLESDWSVRLLEGKARASVPPAARGFVVKAADSDIIDLGTEFALEVTPDIARVHVVDGEVKLSGGKHDGDHLFTGESKLLKGVGTGDGPWDGLIEFGELQRRREAERRQRFAQWKSYTKDFRNDKRLIAYYPIAESNFERFVPNFAGTGSELDGTLVGSVGRGNGRFGMDSASLSFDRPGSRVRVLANGEFDAITLASWVKIERLDNLYNAIFMSDGYETGEPHWQIRQDGQMMFSVMVDDTPGSGTGPMPDARLNWVYHSGQVWDSSKRGDWIHVAAVYDPTNRRVRQFANGKMIGNEKISDKYFVDKLRIGPAEIGNWGQPFRASSDFAVRNLNGSIDELSIFAAALTEDEIKSLFEQGKPHGF